MQKNAQILVVLVSLALSLALFGFWLPEKIKSQAWRISEHEAASQSASNSIEILSQELLTYIDEQRTKIKESDQLDFEAELLSKLQTFHKEYMKSSEEYLSERFLTFNLNQSQDSVSIPVPEGLKEIVNFWVHIFGHYDSNQVVFYHEEDVGIVYSVLDFTQMNFVNPEESSTLKEDAIFQEKQRLKNVLARVFRALKVPGEFVFLEESEKRIYQMLLDRSQTLDLSESKIMDGLTFRYGFKHRMKQAMALSSKYMPLIQKIFKSKGLPDLLLAIPFVESSFNVKAYSSADAAGLWQFIPGTGKQYLKIDSYVDERLDPVLSTFAAAAHLAHEYEMLGSWPLAINAYNTGPGRILKAVKELGTKDISVIIKNFKGSGYGFDSRNYFPEVLAAFEIFSHSEKYFGELGQFEPEDAEYIRMASDTNLPQLIEQSGLHFETIINLNPALKPDLFEGARLLPKGYFLKVPSHHKDNVLLAAQELYMNEERAAYHVVKKGESLLDIAQNYDIDEAELRNTNSLLPDQKLKQGEILKLPHSYIQKEVSYQTPESAEIISEDEAEDDTEVLPDESATSKSEEE